MHIIQAIQRIFHVQNFNFKVITKKKYLRRGDVEGDPRVLWSFLVNENSNLIIITVLMDGFGMGLQLVKNADTDLLTV